MNFLYSFFGDNMKVKIFDEAHEKDLEEAINNFLENITLFTTFQKMYQKVIN